MIQRHIKKHILKVFGQNKLIIIYGARQVGKTTLCKEIAQEFGGRTKFIDCDMLSNQELLSSQDKTLLMDVVSGYDLVVIDEAQRVPNIGINLKILIDNNPKAQIIATGSSSFDLANKINEPLTGRTWTFTLYPLSFMEILGTHDVSRKVLVDKFLMFGGYPGVFDLNTDLIPFRLEEITSQYLYKDILNWENIQKPNMLVKLLQLLALQLGSEVSLNEVALKLQITRATVERYIDLLEKTFIIFRLYPLRRNQRRVIGRHYKIYFYDLGIRNSLIRNFNSPAIRSDIGGMWENFCIVERLKYIQYNRLYRNMYFWRSYSQQEIDYIEEYDGEMHSFDFKWQERPVLQPKEFKAEFPNSTFEIIDQVKFYDFLR